MIIFRSFAGMDIGGYYFKDNWRFASFGYPTNLCSKNYLNWTDSSDQVKLSYECYGNT